VDWLGILKAWGRKPPVNQPEVSPLLDQGGRSLDVSRAYYTDLLLHQDHILRSQGGAGWNALDIYAKVRSDPQVKACWQQRTHALLSLPVKVEVGLPRGRAVSKVDEMARDFWAERVLAGDWDGWSELAHWGCVLRLFCRRVDLRSGWKLCAVRPSPGAGSAAVPV